MSQPKWRVLVVGAVGIVCLLALAGVVVLQASEVAEESRRLAFRTESVLKEVAVLKTVASKGQEMDEQLALLASKVTLVERIVPESLGLVEFKASFEGECASRGIVVVGWKVREEKSQDVQRGLIGAELGGDLSQVPDLERRMRLQARLADWREGRREGELQAVDLTVYALPRKPGDKPMASCEDHGSGVWLWPYTSSLLAKRQALEDACRQLAALSGPKSQADRYYELKSHLLAAVAVVEKLRPEGRGN